jgi:membrane fusion protein (multidrug efflux system)
VTNTRFTTLVSAAMALLLSAACEKPAPPPPPPPEVYVTAVVKKDVPEYLELAGQTIGKQDVEIRARVEGFLETMNFREGSFVAKGTLLYTIDRKPLEASLAAAEADQKTAEGATRQGQQRRHPLSPAGREAGRQPAGTG